MSISPNQLLQDFITDYNLKRPDGVTAFDATVSFYKEKILHSISSEVQIINMPAMMVLYIFEFFKEAYELPEMYATENFKFRYSKGGPLQIIAAENSQPFFVSILPLHMQQPINGNAR